MQTSLTKRQALDFLKRYQTLEKIKRKERRRQTYKQKFADFEYLMKLGKEMGWDRTKQDEEKRTQKLWKKLRKNFKKGEN